MYRKWYRDLLARGEKDFRWHFNLFLFLLIFFVLIFSLRRLSWRRNIWAHSSDLFWDTILQNHSLHAEVSSCPRKGNSFIQSTFYTSFKYGTIIFFLSLLQQVSLFSLKQRGFEWFISHHLDDIHTQMWQLGSCSPGWRWNDVFGLWWISLITVAAVDVTVSLASYILRKLFSWIVYPNMICTRPSKQIK